MPNPTRFAGYDSPAQLVADPALTREQKVGALLAWRATLRRAGGERARHAALAAEIDRTLERLQAAQA
jgi:hypothetical protein